MKKKTTEISINTSSGAEKVEKIEKEAGEKEMKTTVKKTSKAPASAKGAAALGGVAGEEKKKTSSVEGKAEKESAAAKERVERAIAKKEAQEKRKAEKKAKAEKKVADRKKRIAEKKALIEKRAAEKKARAEKHAAERKALAEKRKAEKEAKLRERAHAKASRNNARYEKKKASSKRRSQNRTHREGNKGYGGWIAAVVSLGVVSLALATTVTVGGVEMAKSRSAMMGSCRGTMYELTELMEHVEGDLDRARVSNTSAQQSRILTDLLVQARLAELDLEKLPITAETDRNVTGFINRTAAECERMLAKLRKGEALSAKDRESLESLYAIQHSVREELNNLVSNMDDKDLMSYIKEGKGSMKDALDRIEKSTLDENSIANGEQTAGAGMRSTPPEGKKEEKKHIEAATAEELCGRYFTGYNIGEFQCIGETVARGYEAYNIQGYDDKGNQLFAEVSQADGALLRFDYYEDCAGNTFDVGNAEKIAEEFLEKLGYGDMEVARLRINGSTTDFTFVYEEDDVLFYPDEIRVKVCRTRGVVSGFDATKYLKNHKPRKEAEAKLTLAEAQGKLYEELGVESSRSVVIRVARGERLAYEFLCSHGEEKYFVFIDATTGEEISIVNVKSTL